MAHLVASLKAVAYLLKPFMPETSDSILNQLGLLPAITLENLKFEDLPENTNVVSKGTPIFPRLDIEKEVAYIKSQMQ